MAIQILWLYILKAQIILTARKTTHQVIPSTRNEYGTWATSAAVPEQQISFSFAPSHPDTDRRHSNPSSKALKTQVSSWATGWSNGRSISIQSMQQPDWYSSAARIGLCVKMSEGVDTRNDSFLHAVGSIKVRVFEGNLDVGGFGWTCKQVQLS
jgi:hypothetical protein